MVAPKSLPVHAFNALIFPILGDCLHQFAFLLSLDKLRARFGTHLTDISLLVTFEITDRSKVVLLIWSCAFAFWC